MIMTSVPKIDEQSESKRHIAISIAKRPDRKSSRRDLSKPPVSKMNAPAHEMERVACFWHTLLQCCQLAETERFIASETNYSAGHSKHLRCGAWLDDGDGRLTVVSLRKQVRGTRIRSPDERPHKSSHLLVQH